MTEEKLQTLNDLSIKIKAQEKILETADRLRSYKVVITDYNNGKLLVPDELQSVIITILEDHHMRILEALEIEFSEM